MLVWNIKCTPLVGFDYSIVPVVQLARAFVSFQVFYSALLEFSSMSPYIEITHNLRQVLPEFSTL